MSRSSVEIEIPQDASPSSVFDALLRDLRASRAIEAIPPLFAWCVAGCPRSRRLSPAARRAALEWLLLDRSGFVFGPYLLRRFVFGEARGVDIAKRREAMLAEVMATQNLSESFALAAARFAVYRAEKAAGREARIVEAARPLAGRTRRKSESLAAPKAPPTGTVGPTRTGGAQ